MYKNFPITYYCLTYRYTEKRKIHIWWVSGSEKITGHLVLTDNYSNMHNCTVWIKGGQISEVKSNPPLHKGFDHKRIKSVVFKMHDEFWSSLSEIKSLHEMTENFPKPIVKLIPGLWWRGLHNMMLCAIKNLRNAKLISMNIE